LLDRALQQRTASLETRVKLAFYLSETGRAPRAISLLEGVEGEDAEALSALGMAYANVGRFRDAVATFERVLDVDATSGLAHINIGSIKLAAGDFAGAEASIARALDIDPALPGGYTAMGALLKKTGRIEQAIGAWRQAIDIDPREFDALYNLTFALAETGKTDEARQVGRRYVESAPPALYRADIEAIRRLIGIW
jgi:tetratricopeptide (TPR) repeat protein